MFRIFKALIAVLIVVYPLSGFGAADARGIDASSRIMNGDAARSDAYPWFVSLGYNLTPDNGTISFCGGSLVAPGWVLTAAHCVYNYVGNPGFVLATVNRDRLSSLGDGEQIVVKQIIVHPNYNWLSKDSDLALLELQRPANNPAIVQLSWPSFPMIDGTLSVGMGHGSLVPLRNYLTDQFALTSNCRVDFLACLDQLASRGYSELQILTAMLKANGQSDPRQGVGYPELVSLLSGLGDPRAVSGIEVADLIGGLELRGQTFVDIAYVVLNASQNSDELREVQLPLLNDPVACQQAIGMNVTENMVCAGYGGSQLKDTCQGDSGGPLVVLNTKKNKWVQVGIVSFGPRCGISYGVYTRVSGFLEWIGQNVPDVNLERIFNYSETDSLGLVQAKGNESSFSILQYWARYYPVSNRWLGFSDGLFYEYDGASFYLLGNTEQWLSAARTSGY